jgi:hypothetical protein
VFEKHREKKAAKEYQHDLSQWQEARDECASLLAIAETFTGQPSSEIMLKSGEAVFAKVAGASLVEDRRGPGHWDGRSSGFSFPVASIGGHSVRYRVGRTRGHYVQGAPTPTAIDTGNLYITNRRVIFQGTRQTRECLFDKLLGYQHDTANGSTIFSVSNRQKATVIHYGTEVSQWFAFRLDLALAHYKTEVPLLVTQLQQELRGLDANRPLPLPPPRPDAQLPSP